MGQQISLLQAENLSKHFPSQQNGFRHIRQLWHKSDTSIRAVDGVSLSVRPGEIVGLVGASGSGKTTLARLLLRLILPTDGRIWLEGRDITTLSRAQMRPYRRVMRMVFQSPTAALNPLRTIGQILREAIRAQTDLAREERQSELKRVLAMVQLPTNVLDQYPYELSGGLKRRVSIARAIVGNPKLIVADEPVAALDTSIRAQIINLMRQIAEQRDVAYLLISHDLSMIRYLSDRVLVMDHGRLVDGPTANVHYPGTVEKPISMQHEA